MQYWVLEEWGKNNDIESVRDFLNNPANAELVGKFNRQLLHTAIRHGRTEIAELLIRHGADVNAQDKHGRTPLHVHLLNRPSVDLCRILLDAGADMNLKDNRGVSPRNCAMRRKRKYPELTELFASHMAQRTLLEDTVPSRSDSEDTIHGCTIVRRL